MNWWPCSLLDALWAPQFFWDAPFRTGIRGNHRALDGAGGYLDFVLAGQEGSRYFAGTLFGVGELCGDAELHHLAVEFLRSRTATSHRLQNGKL
jgi:hypothetical protein